MIKKILEDLRIKNNKTLISFDIKNKKKNNILTISTRINNNNSKDEQNETLKFSFLYKKSLKKKKINLKLKTIGSFTKKMNSEIARRITFTNSDYPSSLKEFDLGFSLENQIYFKRINQPLNIIEQLDNEDIMMKFLPDNYCFIFKEKFYYNEKDNFSLFFNQFIQQIQNYKFNNQNQLKTFYSLKKLRHEKINLNFYSFCIRIYKNLEIIKEINLPINIIPFYFSINYRNFIFFISRILIFENNEIYLEKNLIEKTINELFKTIDFFNKDCLLFDNKNYENKKFKLIINKEEFQLEILTPMIKIKKEKTIEIIKLAGKGLLLNLSKNNFSNWGNIILCYLSSFKYFRNIAKKIYKNENEENAFINLDNIIQQNILYNQFLKNSENFEKSFSFMCFIPEKNVFNFYTFLPYKISINYNNEEYKFQLSFSEMKKLYKLQKKYNINYIINKCIIIKNQKLFFSLDLIKNYNIKELKNFFYPHTSNHIILYIKNPRLIWNEINSDNKIIIEYYELNDNLLEKICHNPLKNYPFIFSSEINNILIEIHENQIRRKSQLKSLKTMKNKKSISESLRVDVKKKNSLRQIDLNNYIFSPQKE